MYSDVKICPFQVESWKWFCPSKRGIIENKLIVLTQTCAGVQSINTPKQTNFFVGKNNATAIKIPFPALWWYTFKQNTDSTSFLKKLSQEGSITWRTGLWCVWTTAQQHQETSPNTSFFTILLLFRLQKPQTSMQGQKVKHENYHLRKLSVW